MSNTALIQVLGAVAYGELKAHEGARAEAEATADEVERRRLRKVAAEELRHHKGFVARLEAMGADPDRAMQPYHRVLDRYHSNEAPDPITEAVQGYLGEGIADDLLTWLRQVVDADTAAFIDTVIEDEVEHEAAATRQLRALLDADPEGAHKAARGARRMFLNMARSGGAGGAPLVAFLRLGKTPQLLDAVFGGMARRLSAIDVDPLRLPGPLRRAVRAHLSRPAAV
ncbi:MAG TPA: ferritin-like fold-containing protein [Acidimicrobiales bacterium]